MAVSNVYYTNMRTTLTENLLQKLERLVKKAGMMDIDFNNKYTAIKIHFGEPGNLAYLRANYSKVLVDLIRSQSGKVFLTDCNTFMWEEGRMHWTTWTLLMRMAIIPLPQDVI